MSDGKLSIEAVDATATDAATSKDRWIDNNLSSIVRFRSSESTTNMARRRAGLVLLAFSLTA